MIEHLFTGTDRPILHSLIRHLWPEETSEPPDLSDTAILVPTRNVGRRVREALALRASEQNRGILSPTVFIPGTLLSAISGLDNPPGMSELSLHVVKALDEQRPETVMAAFGRTYGTDLNEKLSIARFFMETRRELGDVLLDYRKASEHPEIGDRDRWRALAIIESAFRKSLHKQGVLDPSDTASQIALDPKPYFTWSRLVVAGAPDFPERVATFLRNLAESLPVEIIVCSGDIPEQAFDNVGRPSADWFTEATIPVPERSIHVTTDIHEANELLADSIAEHPSSRSACVCGAGLPANAEALAFECKGNDLSIHNPAGHSFASTPAGQFLRHLTGICFGEEISDWIAWARDPFVGQWMRATGSSAEREAWIQESDQWLEEILPNSISDFLETLAHKRPRSNLFAKTISLRNKARKLGNVFRTFEDPEFRPLLDQLQDEDGIDEFAESFSKVRSVAEELFRGDELQKMGRWAIEQALQLQVYEDRPHDAIEVLGWLELLWSEGPWLQIPDLYEGAIPSTTGSHPLLPETLRSRLGMRGNVQRDARDAYLLRTLLALREKDGRVDLYVPKKDLDGGAVSPSRLLYFTDSADLPERVANLSRERTGKMRQGSVNPIIIEASHAKTVQKWIEGLDRIHVTSFASWIRCPFSFYLERICGAETIKADRLEMDPRHFGTGLHEVLRRLDTVEDQSLDWENDAAVIARGEELLNSWFLQQFGRRPGLLLELQKEGLSRRIEAAIKLRIDARREGWTPIHVEWNFRDEGLLTIEGIPLSGQIDLVEERGDELRVIDYKTSDKPTPPEVAHLMDLTRKRSFTPSQRVEVEGLPGMGWTNLQLPLYAMALRRKYPDRPIRVAYGLLPRAITESTIIEWPNFTDELAEAALEAATTIFGFWKGNGFWPPSSTFQRSDLYEWSGPSGIDGWEQGDLTDISEPTEEKES